jgi:hypothetical protein
LTASTLSLQRSHLFLLDLLRGLRVVLLHEFLCRFIERLDPGRSGRRYRLPSEHDHNHGHDCNNACNDTRMNFPFHDFLTSFRSNIWKRLMQCPLRSNDDGNLISSLSAGEPGKSGPCANGMEESLPEKCGWGDVCSCGPQLRCRRSTANQRSALARPLQQTKRLLEHRSECRSTGAAAPWKGWKPSGTALNERTMTCGYNAEAPDRALASVNGAYHGLYHVFAVCQEY